ncbi:MAG: hypothetical protein B7Y56_03425 [Gallionellales bacterium 35-53-114]|jgi:hypothetical protein|nr:MAG: hypothetical protein B7Y56_03425 [Gallionellales bacterium 35-53-114]OYZ65156.1 MAG: hypothetical protein B7Y04_00585 [Gallionellales bacterium 24-53-125]OZB08064.1 MAG: hypothetical protein B7X61_11035 [Gallionellales bacterium 39-52-133]HQS59968.1 hypothetical protein [Gallionellaceae bacterium]HQS76650.1 hypothetical protein [Gallionellaceae bacterium]
MSEISDRMNLIKTTLATALPARVVTRDLMDFSMRADEDLQAGIYTLVSKGEGGYQNLLGRLAMDGTQRILLVGQFVAGADADPSAIEDAELAMIAEVKTFLQALPATLCRLKMTGFRQSEQMDTPYGWIVADLEFVK